MSKCFFKLGLLGASALMLTAMATDANAQAQDKTRWKMQSAFASSLTHLGPSACASPRTSTACPAASSRSSSTSPAR